MNYCPLIINPTIYLDYTIGLKRTCKENLRDEMIISLFKLLEQSMWLIPDDILVDRNKALEAIEEMLDGKGE